MLETIVNRIGEVNDLIGGISDASVRQSTSLQYVHRAISDMDKMTQQNAAMVEESTAAARSMAGQAEQLAGMVATFKVSTASHIGLGGSHRFSIAA